MLNELLFDKLPKQHSFEADLWAAADNLRANAKLKPSEYSAPVFGLLFLRYAFIKFQAVAEKIEAEFQAQTVRNIRTIEAMYVSECGFYLPEVARYDYLLTLEKSIVSQKAVVDAVIAFDKANPDLKDILPQNEFLKMPDATLRELIESLATLQMNDGDQFGKFFEYLRRIITRQTEQLSDFSAASQQIDTLIDEAIVAKNYIIKPEQEIDLSGIDLEKLQEKFEQTPYKRLAINDLVAFLQEQVKKLLARNVTRIDLAQRLQDLIDAYNTRGSDVKRFFKELREYAALLRQEEIRSVSEGLTEEELEIFDLLFQEKLSVTEKQKVKLAAKALLQKLKDNDVKRSIMVTDWHRNTQSQGRVKKLIGDVLDENLPQESYDTNLFSEKVSAVYTHIYNTATLGARYWA